MMYQGHVLDQVIANQVPLDNIQCTYVALRVYVRVYTHAFHSSLHSFCSNPSFSLSAYQHCTLYCRSGGLNNQELVLMS